MEREWKKCTVCHAVYPIEQIANTNNGRKGSICKQCCADKQRHWYNEHRIEIALKRRIKSLEKFATENGYKVEISYAKLD